jgi:hypothetical protein
VFTVVVAVAELFAPLVSVEVVAVVAVLERIEPLAKLDATLTTMVNETVSLAATVAFENVIVPLAPTAVESVLVHVGGVVTETRVVLAGNGSATVTLLAVVNAELFLKLIV